MISLGMQHDTNCAAVAPPPLPHLLHNWYRAASLIIILIVIFITMAYQNHRHQLSSPSLTAFESLLFRLLVKFWGFVSAKAGFLQGTSFALDYAGTPSKFLDCFEWLSSQAEHNWPKQQWSVLDGFWQWRNLPLYDNELIDVKLSENILDTENFAKVWIQKQI